MNQSIKQYEFYNVNQNSYRGIRLKTFLPFLLACCLLFKTTAQPANKGQLPLFKIQLVNGQLYTYKKLPQNKPVVLINFSPTCGHCRHLADALAKNRQEFKDKQIVMICWEPLDEVKQFYNACHLAACSNIKIGTEGYSFLVQQYYHVQQFPFAALYNRYRKEVALLRNYGDNTKGLIDYIMRF